jgi:phosphate transport system permease protein
MIPVQIHYSVSYSDAGRDSVPELTVGEPTELTSADQKITAIAHVIAPDGPITVAAINDRDVVILSVRERKALIGKPKRDVSRQQITLPIEGIITHLLLDGRGDDVFVGTSQGQIVRIDLRDPTDPRIARSFTASSGSLAAITAMSFLIGDRTIVVGDAAGGISSYQILRDDLGERTLAKVYEFPKCNSGVVSIEPSSRDKGFVAADAAGIIHLCYGTTGAELLSLKASSDVRAAILAPKSDGILVVDGTGQITHWALTNPHPEINLHSLFGKVWYEGYNSPEYVWQSTGGTDDFEGKFSLTPLIFGTLKGTLYALVFAVPIALLAALYASQFMHPDIKRYVKPSVEIMAALPSVVLGFIAGLWLAPMVERFGPGLFLFPLIAPLLTLAALGFWQLTPSRLRGRMRTGTEVFLLVPVVIVSGVLAFYAGGALERHLLGGDYRNWLFTALGLTFDQRNSLVVGFAMGFAVIPIIFTIADDSLSNVPQHLTAGSLALGATRWQTAVRVVLPTASPGIFSAVMIGFGRAVGETMIVLMATGNTPVMDWSVFNGFRALSANIAVELPEAPEGGTLYRVLFLAALLLFTLTFFVNTLAELVRLKLRKKYRYL